MSKRRRLTSPAVIAAALGGLLVGLLIAFFLLDYLPGGYRVGIYAMATAFFLVVFLVILAMYAKNWLFQRVFKTDKDIDDFLPEAEQATAAVVSGVVDVALVGMPKEKQQQAKTNGAQDCQLPGLGAFQEVVD